MAGTYYGDDPLMSNDKVLGVAAIGVLTLASVPPIFATMLPDKHTIQSTPLTDKDATDFISSVRNEEITASALAFAVGVSGSVLTSSPWPVLGVLLMIGFFIWRYESGMRATASISYTDIRDDQ